MKMKRELLVLMIGLFVSVSAIAQSKAEKNIEKKANAAVEKVLTTVELSDEEKATYFEIQKVRFEERATFPKGLKESDPELFKKMNLDNRKDAEKKVIEAFGKERGKEIIVASKKKKKK